MANTNTPPTPILITKQELADELDCSIAQIGNYIRDGMPVAKQGKSGVSSQFDKDACLQWYADTYETEESESLAAAKLRSAIARASIDELNLQKERGEVIEIAEVAHLVSSEYSKVRNLLLSLPSKLSGLVHSLETQAEVKELLDQEFRNVLMELTGDKQYTKEKPVSVHKKTIQQTSDEQV